MSASLRRGGSMWLRYANGAELSPVLLGIGWSGIGADVQPFAFLCSEQGLVQRGADFLHPGNPVSMGREAFLLGRPPGQAVSGPDRAQLVLDTRALPASIRRIAVGVATTHPTGSLRAIGALRGRVADLSIPGGPDVAGYTNGVGYAAAATSVVVWEVVHQQGAWVVRATEQSWVGGLPALAQHYGVARGA